MSTGRQDTHRSRLLEAARRLLRERDYGNITARELVAASDTNLGSIVYHFGSKEALLNEAIGLALEEWVERIGAATRAGSVAGIGELMTKTLSAVLDDYETIRPYHLAYIAALARSVHSPALREQLAAHYERQRARVARWMTDAPGERLGQEQAVRVASLMIAAADGMLIQRFTDEQQAFTSRQLAAAAAHAIAGGPPAPRRSN